MLTSRRHRPAAHRMRRRTRRTGRSLALEGLERRALLTPTMYTVKTTADAASGTGNSSSLR
jgi:hypothetical protein